MNNKITTVYLKYSIGKDNITEITTTSENVYGFDDSLYSWITLELEGDQTYYIHKREISAIFERTDDNDII